MTVELTAFLPFQATELLVILRLIYNQQSIFMAARKSKTKATTKKKRAVSVRDPNQQIRKIMRSILNKIENAMPDLAPPADEKEAKRQTNYHDRVFGKNSLATTLVMLAELLIKLDQAEKNKQVEVAPNPSGDAMAPADMALVEAFIRRMQQRETVVSSPVMPA